MERCLDKVIVVVVCGTGFGVLQDIRTERMGVVWVLYPHLSYFWPPAPLIFERARRATVISRMP